MMNDGGGIDLEANIARETVSVVCTERLQVQQGRRVELENKMKKREDRPKLPITSVVVEYGL